MTYRPQVQLPHTDLTAGRVGLGSSFGLSAGDLRTAFEHGINFFYWGSLRRPGFAQGIRDLSRRHRDQIIVAVQSYARWPGALVRLNVESALWRLGLDYADVLILGWHNQRPFQDVLDAAATLRQAGRVRFLMMSGHNRPFFPEMAKQNFFDLFMVRYNAAHRGAEKDVFPKLPKGNKHPGIIAYTATRWATLLDAAKMPPGERAPHARHCYRFCLSSPDVDVVLSGPANRKELREACAAIDAGPLNADELKWMRRVGDHVYGRTSLRSLTD